MDENQMGKPPRELYDQREQSYVKHLFLTRYLQAGAFKIFQGKSSVFNYVDAFAGPWRVQDDDALSDSSFFQVLNILDEVRNVLKKRGHTEITLRIRLCEQNSSRVKLLREFAARRSQYDIQIFEGRFEDNLEAIAASCSGGFTFTFIDPTGWNLESSNIFSYLRKVDGEFLFNFMSDEINRHAGWDGVAASFGRFLACPKERWREQFSAADPCLSNEEKILHILKQRMREEKVAEFLPHMTIQHPRKDRVRMRLILGTHSPVAVNLFRDTQKRVLEEQIKLRHKIATKESGQPHLFSSTELAQWEMQNIGAKNNITRETAKRKLLTLLTEMPGIRYKRLAPKILEDIDLTRPELNKLVMQWRDEELITFKIPPRKRVPQDDTIINLAC